MEKETIYNIVCGIYEKNKVCALNIKNEFEKGRECQVLIEKIYQARLNLERQLLTV